MHRILTVAKREYTEAVRKKAFIAGLLLPPLLVAALLWAVGALERHARTRLGVAVVAVTDLSDVLSSLILRECEAYNAAHPDRLIDLQVLPTEGVDLDDQCQVTIERVRRGELHAYLISGDSLVEGTSGCAFYVSTDRRTADWLFDAVKSAVQEAVLEKRYELYDVPSSLIAALRKDVPINYIDFSLPQGEERRAVSRLAPFFLMYMMFLGLTSINNRFISSIIEEKDARIIDLLLSSLSPFELMGGKIIGLAAVGLTMVGVWAVAAGVGAVYHDMAALFKGHYIVYFCLYYIAGVLLCGAIYAGVGSAFSSYREAQSVAFPVTLLLIVPVAFSKYLADNPDGLLINVLSFIPPATPMVMILRIASGSSPPWFQIVGSFVLLVAAIPLAIWLSAKVFRVGILAYGKAPTVRELVRWLRQR